MEPGAALRPISAWTVPPCFIAMLRHRQPQTRSRGRVVKKGLNSLPAVALSSARPQPVTQRSIPGTLGRVGHDRSTYLARLGAASTALWIIEPGLPQEHRVAIENDPPVLAL